MIRPTDYFIEDFEYTKDDDHPLIVEPFLNNVAHNMTGSLIEIIISDKNGVVKTLTSGTASPSIVINNSELTIDPAVFTTIGTYKYKFRETAGGNIATIGKGTWIVRL